MRRLPVIVLLLVLAAPAGLRADIDDLFRSRPLHAPPGEQVVAISHRFLGTPYRAGTLGGGPGQTEVLTVSLDAVDCFTLIDYVEAARRASSAADFTSSLQAVRYHGAVRSWATRKHFFTDWLADGHVRDVTDDIGGPAVVRTEKQLNRKGAGELHLPGVAVRPREVSYIPTAAVADTVLAGLASGDYIGIYSTRAGLDVAHVGILVKRDSGLFLRHASNRPGVGKVVDSPLLEYLQGKPGIIVLRARSK